MGFLFFRRGQERAPEQSEYDGPLRKAACYHEDHEGKKLRSARTVFSLWSAAKYVLILSVLLWWLPMFGQMIAGYVGGRKAGSPWRGVAAAIVPVLIIFIVILVFEKGIMPNEAFGVEIAPAALFAAIASKIPLMGPYIDFTREYVTQFVAALSGSSPYQLNSYLLTLAFAYIGGIIADQNRRELEYSSGPVTSHTTVLVARNPWEGHPTLSAPEIIPQQQVGYAPIESPFWRRAAKLFHYEQPVRRAALPERFEQLVPVNCDDEEYEEAVPLRRRKSTRVEKRKDAARASVAARKRRKKQGELRFSDLPSQKAHRRKTKKVKGIRASETSVAARPDRRGKHRREEPLRVNPRDPKTMKRVQKRIEEEWDPKRKKGSVAFKSYRRGIRRREEEKHSGHREAGRRGAARRSWDSM